MKKQNSALIVGLLLCATAAAQPQLQGYVSGNYGPGNYLVVGDITLSAGQSMVMLPGTNFFFAGNHRFTVYGDLHAVGNATDSIKFIPYDASHRWAGIHFRESEQSALAYCQVTGSDSGGIDLFHSAPTISHCTISDNSAPWRGGGIWVGYWECNTTISNCTISGNFANWSGGGIATGYNCLITNCVITENSTNGEGGGMAVDQCGPIISYCTISDNEAYGGGDCGGGGIMIYKGNPTISHCLITGNSANTFGGGLLLTDAEPTISNCTISRNSADFGGGIFFEVYYAWFSTIVNTIVEGNLGNYGVYFQWGPYAEITFSDFYNNQQGNFYNGPVGVETLVGVNTNGDSCDVFCNIFEDPLFEDPNNGNFQLTWANFPIPDSTMSPCIDAGDPYTPPDPDGTIADMGALYFDQSLDVSVTLSPYNPPIVIPPSGGEFDYYIEVENYTMAAQTFDLWAEISLPGIGTVPVMNLSCFTLPGSVTLGRNRTQQVPCFAPAGTYTYYACIGRYPWVIDTYDSFIFEKEGSDRGGSLGTPTDWPCTGEPFTVDYKTEEIPEAYALHTPYPNPFNPTTTIRFELPVASLVRLAVYDISGRMVRAHSRAPLQDAWRDAGRHEVVFDGSGLASGIYIYRLEAGEFTASGKMVLMK